MKIPILISKGKNIMNTKFKELEKFLRKIAQARQDAKSTIANLNAKRKDYSDEHIKEYTDPEIKKVKNGMAALRQTNYEEAARC